MECHRSARRSSIEPVFDGRRVSPWPTRKDRFAMPEPWVRPRASGDCSWISRRSHRDGRDVQFCDRSDSDLRPGDEGASETDRGWLSPCWAAGRRRWPPDHQLRRSTTSSCHRAKSVDPAPLRWATRSSSAPRSSQRRRRKRGPQDRDLDPGPAGCPLCRRRQHEVGRGCVKRVHAGGLAGCDEPHEQLAGTPMTPPGITIGDHHRGSPSGSPPSRPS